MMSMFAELSLPSSARVPADANHGNGNGRAVTIVHDGHGSAVTFTCLRETKEATEAATEAVKEAAALAAAARVAAAKAVVGMVDARVAAKARAGQAKAEGGASGLGLEAESLCRKSTFPMSDVEATRFANHCTAPPEHQNNLTAARRGMLLFLPRAMRIAQYTAYSRT